MAKDRDNTKFKFKSYWDERFVEEDSFEWLAGFDTYGDLLCSHLRVVATIYNCLTVSQVEDNILVVGCGNSDMSEKVYERGFKKVIKNHTFGIILNSDFKHRFFTSGTACILGI